MNLFFIERERKEKKNFLKFLKKEKLSLVRGNLTKKKPIYHFFSTYKLSPALLQQQRMTTTKKNERYVVVFSCVRERASLHVNAMIT